MTEFNSTEYVIQDTLTGKFCANISPNVMVEFDRASKFDERHASARLREEVKRWELYINKQVSEFWWNDEFYEFANERKHLGNFGLRILKVKVTKVLED